MRGVMSLFVSLSLIVGQPLMAATAEQTSLELPSGNGVEATVYGKQSATRVLWIGSGFGLHSRHKQVAQDLARAGLQVWQVDIIEALFLTRGAEALRSIPAGVMAELINAVSENGKYKILLMSGSYGAIPTLRGAHAWLEGKPTQRTVIGVVLFSPYLFTHVPNVGEAPQFVEVTRSTSVPVYIFQAEKNTNRWHMPEMVKELQLHAPVYTELMKGVTSLYYEKDTASETLAKLKSLAGRIKEIIPLLSAHQYELQAVAMDKNTVTENKLGMDDRLKAYQGTLRPQAFALQDINGKRYAEDDFKGKVSIINFWATWCPPCVEEIPSLNRLRKKMQGKPFQLISINYAESAERIRAFMKKVAVDFPVLVDPEGRTAGNWRVVAFPSTFVIGPDGVIRYGVNAAIHWDTEEVVQQIDALLK